MSSKPGFGPVLGDMGITTPCGGLGGLPGGGTEEWGTQGGETGLQAGGESARGPRAASPAGAGLAERYGYLAGDHDLARAPQVPALPLLTSAGVACSRSPGWGVPTHHLPSPFILRSPARRLALLPAVGSCLCTAPPGHPGHWVHPLSPRGPDNWTRDAERPWQLPTLTAWELLASPTTLGSRYKGSEPGGPGSNPGSAMYPFQGVGPPRFPPCSPISSSTQGR